MTDREDIDAEAMRRRLEQRRDDLLAVDAVGEDSRRPVELDPQVQGRLSRMDALQQQAMSQAQQRRRAAELERIETALARLAEGEFGYCVTCGEPIALKRLEHDPSVPTCIDCAAG
ncbi:MAG: TraR/DksA C4-type zinc finger protein [Azospirillaceae bacterium]